MQELLLKVFMGKNPKNSPLARRIDEFAAKYDDQPDLQNEERLAELMGIMAADYTMLTKPQKNKVIKFLQELANKIGLNINISEFTQQDSDVVDLFNTLAGKISTGESITDTDIEAFNFNQEEPGPVGPPVKLKKPKGRQQAVEFKDNYPLSLINKTNKIDIDALINDIISKDQTLPSGTGGSDLSEPFDEDDDFPLKDEFGQTVDTLVFQIDDVEKQIEKEREEYLNTPFEDLDKDDYVTRTGTLPDGKPFKFQERKVKDMPSQGKLENLKKRLEDISQELRVVHGVKTVMVLKSIFLLVKG